jgi:drug/metabolite transporter (DMT)-like permease
MAGLCHAAVYGLSMGRRWPRERQLWRHASVMGIFGTALPMMALVTGLQYQSSGMTSLLITTVPAITVVLAHFFLPDEALNWRKGLGVALALGGAGLLALRGESGLSDVDQADPAGYGLILLAMVFFSGSTIYARRYMKDLEAFDVSSIRMFVAALAVMPLSAVLIGFDLGAVTGQGYFALGYATLVGTFGGMMLSFYNVKRFGASVSTMSAYVTPIVASAGGVLILEETFTTGMLVGMGLIILGIGTIRQQS